MNKVLHRLAMALALLSASISAHAADSFSIDGFTYTIITNNPETETYNVEISRDKSSTSTSVVIIPESVEYNGITWKVTQIGNDAFSKCIRLTSVTIPSSVTSIGSMAFYYCIGVTSVTIPNSVTSIGSGAFHRCAGLTSVTIPNSVTSIESGAFSGCTGLTHIDLQNSAIGDYMFQECTGLTSVTIPSSVTSIGFGAFYGCTGLTSVDLQNSAIGDYMFSKCTGLTSVTIPSSVTSIESGAFSGCTGLTSVDLQNSVIGDGMFYGCTGLTSVTIPNSVTSIESGAFSGCSGLTSVTIPNSVISIGSDAFNGCSGLTSVTIPNSVTSIGSDAFKGCTGLTSLDIPSSVTNLRYSDIFFSYTITSQTFLHTQIRWDRSIITMEGRPPLLESINEFIEPSYHGTYYVANYYHPSDPSFNQAIFTVRFCNGLTSSFKTPTNACQSISFTNESNPLRGKVTAELAYYDQSIDSEISNVKFVIDNNTIDTGTSLSCELDDDDTPNKWHKLSRIDISFTNGMTYTYSKEFSFLTPDPSFATGEATATSSSSARLMCGTNLPDGTVGGFEWRRDEAPAGMPSTKVPCPVMGGQLTGSLRNLKDDVYYKCRPYYIAVNEQEFYGNWFYVFTGDAGVYFEPEVQTLSPMLSPADPDDEECTVTLQGYALPGSDDIESQGFEYRSTGNAGGANSPARAEGAWTEVTSSGILMNATVTGLSPATEYVCRAFAVTAKGRFTGEEVSFTTPGEAGLGETVADSASAPEVTGYYNLQGVRLQSPIHGLNIVVYSDGTTRKVIVK